MTGVTSVIRSGATVARFANVGVRRSKAQRTRTAMSAAVAEQTKLQSPHGGKLVNLLVPRESIDDIAKDFPKRLECTDRQACDVECLTMGFMGQKEYDSVVETMHLTDGTMFGLPIVFDTNDEDISVGDKLLLTYNGQNIGTLEVDEKWVPNKPNECKHCYGTTSLEHPAVQMVAMQRGKYYIGGKVQGLERPKRVFQCQTPEEVRATLPEGKDVLAFQCRNPIHKAHYELFIRALEADNVGKEAVCIVHPTCGPTQDDDIPGIVRYHTYEVLKEEVANPYLRWAYLPYSMHMAGPREAIQHMIIRKNFGATHFIIGRDMAGCKSSLTGEDFYGPYDAQNLARDSCKELDMQIVPSLNITYTEEKGYVTADVAEKEGLTQKKLSGTAFRQALRRGEDIPDWFAFKSVVRVLREEDPSLQASASEAE